MESTLYVILGNDFTSKADLLENPVLIRLMGIKSDLQSDDDVLHKIHAVFSLIDWHGGVNFLSPGVYPTSQVSDFAEAGTCEHLNRSGRSCSRFAQEDDVLRAI